MIERPPSLGVFAPREDRALRPPVTPNDNDPADVPPATVGPPAATPGDPNGVEIIDGGPGAPWPRSVIRPSPWSGWPDDWATPNWWGRVEDLTDMAWACMDLISGLVATMPPYLIGADSWLDASWMVNPDPDRYNSWGEFAKQLFWDFLGGEAFVVCTARSPATLWPARFHVVEPWMVNVELGSDGRRHYSIGGADLGVEGDPLCDVMQIRYQSRVHDARGHGPLEAGNSRLVAARLLGRYVTNFVAGGGLPSGVITHPDELSTLQATELQDRWLVARTSMMGLPAVLSGGVTFEATQASPAQMGMVDLAQLTDSRIAVLLRVPPFLMGLPSGGDSLTYSNVTSLFDYFWRTGLKPRAGAVCTALSQWLLPRGTTLEVNRDEFVRPGPLERAQTYEILIRCEVMTPEEARVMERLGLSSGAESLPEAVLT